MVAGGVAMMLRLRQLSAAALALAAVLALVLLSRVTWRASDEDTAELRLSWRMPAPSYRHCRPPTEAELEGVLPHMRPSEICNDVTIPFRLTILLNEDTLHSGPVEGSGSRARTLTIFSSFPVSPGSYDLEVAFLPEEPADSVSGLPGAATRAPAADSAHISQDFAMTLRAAVTAGPGDVILVSVDENGRLYAIDAGARNRPRPE